MFTGNYLDIATMQNETLVQTFLQNAVRIYGAYDFSRDALLEYINENQSPQLNGNTEIKTKYYAIAGISAPELWNRPLKESLYFDLIPNYDSQWQFDYSIYETAKNACKEFPSIIIDNSYNDDVVELYSQLGVVYNRGILQEKIRFENICVYITPELKYGQGLFGLMLGNMYHVGILEEISLGDTIVEYILAENI